MKTQPLFEWMKSFSLPAKIEVLALVYAGLTVCARELFLPDRSAGSEKRVLQVLHGLNELHHTLANQLVACAADEQTSYSMEAFERMLLEIADHYRINNFLTAAVEFARTRNPGV